MLRTRGMNFIVIYVIIINFCQFLLLGRLLVWWSRWSTKWESVGARSNPKAAAPCWSQHMGDMSFSAIQIFDTTKLAVITIWFSSTPPFSPYSDWYKHPSPYVLVLTNFTDIYVVYSLSKWSLWMDMGFTCGRDSWMKQLVKAAILQLGWSEICWMCFTLSFLAAVNCLGTRICPALNPDIIGPCFSKYCV